MATSSDDVQRRSIAALSHAVLRDVFDEHDAERRASAIARLFAPDARFIDHDGVHTGGREIDVAVDALQARFAGFRFTTAGEPDVLDGAARVAWHYGPPSEPAKVRGADTILVENGRVTTLLVFLEQH